MKQKRKDLDRKEKKVEERLQAAKEMEEKITSIGNLIRKEKTELEAERKMETERKKVEEEERKKLEVNERKKVEQEETKKKKVEVDDWKKKKVEERSAKGEEKSALFHIPIEGGRIVSDPSLIRDMKKCQNYRCYRQPNITCGHLEIAYSGKLRHYEWRNVVSDSLPLKRQLEAASDDDDFLPSRRKC